MTSALRIMSAKWRTRGDLDIFLHQWESTALVVRGTCSFPFDDSLACQKILFRVESHREIKCDRHQRTVKYVMPSFRARSAVEHVFYLYSFLDTFQSPQPATDLTKITSLERGSRSEMLISNRDSILTFLCWNRSAI